jgi:hypothetical protein
MDAREMDKAIRQQQRFERLGTDKPVCVICGFDDDRALERHHIAGQSYDDAEAIVCKNCHRVLSDDQRDHPVKIEGPPTKVECIGRLLCGLADLFELLAQKLREFGKALIELARDLLAQPGKCTTP